LNKFTDLHNNSNKIIQENPIKQYYYVTRLIRYLKLIIVVLFGVIVSQTIRYINGQTDGLGVWFLPFALGIIFLPLIYFVAKSIKATKQ